MITVNSDHNLAQPKSRTSLAFKVGVFVTVVILVSLILQIAKFGDWPPFDVSAPPMSLSETGDFVGGWANSLALVWLIVVAVLQQRALQIQREELDISRREFRETRSEIKRQANAASEQAEHSAAILRLEHRRMYAESLTRDREMLRSMVLAIVLRASNNADRNNLEVTTLRNLIRTFSKVIEQKIGNESSATSRRGEIRRLADDALDVTNFFDEIADTSKNLDSIPESSVYHLRDYAHIYERCKRIQNIADNLDSVANGT